MVNYNEEYSQKLQEQHYLELVQFYIEQKVILSVLSHSNMIHDLDRNGLY